jgi:hypothetical protein
MRLPHLPVIHTRGVTRTARRLPPFVMTLLTAFAAFAALALVLAPHDGPRAAGSDIRLVMVEEKGCRFCRMWDAQIGRAYPKTAEGRFAPLKRVRRGAPEIRGFNPVVYTPTFIVVRSGEEIGRITGYPGQDYFWSELTPILSAAGFASSLF